VWKVRPAQTPLRASGGPPPACPPIPNTADRTDLIQPRTARQPSGTLGRGRGVGSVGEPQCGLDLRSSIWWRPGPSASRVVSNLRSVCRRPDAQRDRCIQLADRREPRSRLPRCAYSSTWRGRGPRAASVDSHHEGVAGRRRKHHTPRRRPTPPGWLTPAPAVVHRCPDTSRRTPRGRAAPVQPIARSTGDPRSRLALIRTYRP